MATLSLKNISTDSGDAALRDLCLEVRDRELLVLAGSCNRELSAVLRAIAGLDPVRAGAIAIGDKSVSSLPSHERDVAMVFPSYALYPHLSVFENVALGTHGRGFPTAEIKKRVEKAAAIVGIESLLAQSARALTGRQRLQVALGRAVVRQPKVILLDDPLAGLASSERAEVRTELIRLQQQLQTTMLCSMSDCVDAMALGDRIAILREGTVSQIDNPAKLYAEPGDLFVAEFLGRPPVALIRGKLRASSGGFTFTEKDGGTVEIAFPSRAELAPYAGKEVIAGIRPEHLHPVQKLDKSHRSRLQGVVEVIEVTGGETLFTVQTGAHSVVSRSPGGVDRAAAGRRMQFEVDAEKAHLFDPESKRRIAS